MVFLTKLITPIIWKISPKKQMQTIQLFASVEIDSCWQLLHAIPYFKDSRIQSQLFHNAIEELHHGSLFEEEYLRLSSKRLPIEMPARKPLINQNPTEAELQKFLLFFHLGESAVCEKFKTLSMADIEPGLKKVFTQISNDELEHGSGALDLIHNQNGKFFLKCSQKKDELVRMVNKIQVPQNILLALLYFLFGFFIYKKMRARFLLDRNQQLEIFKNQITEFQQKVRNL